MSIPHSGSKPFSQVSPFFLSLDSFLRLFVLPVQLINQSFLHWHLIGKILIYMFSMELDVLLFSFSYFPSLASGWIIHSPSFRHKVINRT